MKLQQKRIAQSVIGLLLSRNEREEGLRLEMQRARLMIGLPLGVGP